MSFAHPGAALCPLLHAPLAVLTWQKTCKDFFRSADMFVVCTRGTTGTKQGHLETPSATGFPSAVFNFLSITAIAFK